MKARLARCRQFLRSEEAPTATEYAVMLALIIIVLVVAIALLGEGLESKMTDAHESF